MAVWDFYQIVMGNSEEYSVFPHSVLPPLPQYYSMLVFGIIVDTEVDSGE